MDEENPRHAHHFPRESVDFSTSFCPEAGHSEGHRWFGSPSSDNQTWPSRVNRSVDGKSLVNTPTNDGFPASHV